MVNNSGQDVDRPQRSTFFNRPYSEADILRLATFIRANPYPILVFNPSGELIKANPAAERWFKRLQITQTDVLPANHAQVVQGCLSGELREPSIEVIADRYTVSLTYHAIVAFKLVYVYAIDITKSWQTEAPWVQMSYLSGDRLLLGWV